jgi:hypothetical protein
MPRSEFPKAQCRSRLRGVITGLLFIYLSALICFLVTNITNARLLRLIDVCYTKYRGHTDFATSHARVIDLYFLSPGKSFLFLLSTGVLCWHLIAPAQQMIKRLTLSALRQTFVATILCVLLMMTVLPVGMGRWYALVSVNPFDQEAGQTYRRLLLPGLAYLYHLSGFLYIILWWAIALLAILAFKLLLERTNRAISLIEETSLLTAGAFAASFQAPGYPDLLVLLLAFAALYDYEETECFGHPQLAALCLALVAHETCSSIVFVPLILFVFGRKSWLPSAAMYAMYLVTLFADFLPNPTRICHSGRSRRRFSHDTLASIGIDRLGWRGVCL